MKEPLYYKFLDEYATLMDPVTSPIRSKNPFISFNSVINFFKFGAFVFMLSAMIYFDNFSKGCWVYLSLHGSYGIIWILKDKVFPDKAFQVKIGTLELIVISLILAGYYMMGFTMVTRIANNDPSDERVFACFFSYVIGVVLMTGTDIQKYVHLTFKKELISNHFLATNRNTNFLGEMLIYFSFAAISNEAIGYIVLLLVWSTVFVSRIWLKERSLMKKQGGQAYIKNTYLLLFKIFENDLFNYLLYSLIIGLVIAVYNLGGIEKSIKLLLFK